VSAAGAVEALQASEDYVRIYRCHVLYLGVGMAALGIIAQFIAGYATAAPWWQMLAISAASVTGGLVMLWLAQAGRPGPVSFGVAIGTFLTTTAGLLYLNHGWDGSHLYPALWIYSVIGIVGLYGSWSQTVVAMVAGIAVAVAGKLAVPDLLFGVGADQSWARVAAMSLWWSAGLLTTGLCGCRTLRIAQAGMQAREALHQLRERERVSAATAARAAELRVAHRIARIGTWRHDLVEGTLTMSDELHQLLGTDPRSFAATTENLLSLVHPDDRPARAAALARAAAGEGAVEHEWRMLRPDGGLAWFWAEMQSETDSSGRVIAVQGVCQDVTERRATAEQIYKLAHHDALTGLANRSLLHAHLSEALARARRAGGTLAVLCLDLDGFKAINDLHGHAAGDALLREVAARLSHNVRETDTVARLGGDEFVVLQTDPGQPEAARILAERLVAVLAEPYNLGAGEAQNAVTTSVGVALFPGDGNDAETLLRNADTALYRAKWAGKNGAAFFRPEMDHELRERRALERDLRQAAARGEFALAWQPLSAAGDSSEVRGFEVLLRWHHPECGLVPPNQFIPMAEACGAITAIGAWVLHEACREAARWTVPLQVAVNISPVQAQQGEAFAEMVEQVLATTGLAPSRLTLEVTEGVLIREVDRVLSALNRLKAQGVQFALDDFGTGYSSLATLRAFPFDKLKIDRSFVAEIGEVAGGQDAAIVQAVLGLARGLGLPAVAEGVETEAQLGALRAAGCEEVQGWLVGRPAPIASFAHLTGTDVVASAA
jgi:diguanylate cyclase (GGDEF)-like protein/PAS domain S-box-containing protein